MHSQKDIHHFLSTLSATERTSLLLELMATGGQSVGASQAIYPGELLRIERWLLNGIDSVSAPRIRNSRLRFWFIFMLLRYGALRLEEIFNLQAANLDLGSCRLLVRQGAHDRDVPLPPHVARLMNDKLEQWPAPIALPQPFRCDGSLIRRSFSQCSIYCEVSPRLLSARALRRHRARELEYAGLPMSLVNLFLGRHVHDSEFDIEQGQKILRQAIANEQFPKTSARNSFYGPLVSLDKRGILVKTALEFASGLTVSAIITDTSCQNLKLALGMPVRALVKAPWVRIIESPDYPRASSNNRFYGKIKAIQEDAEAIEIMVALPQGNIICALYASGEKPAFPVNPGDNVGVEFSPLAVILTSV